MKKIIVFSTRDDEEPFMKKENEKYGFDILYIKEPLTKDNIEITKGIDAISVSSAYMIDEEMLHTLHLNGVGYIATRATGHNHVDTELAKKYELHLGYVPKYSPNSISEFTLFLTLAVVRNIKACLRKVNEHDFTYSGLMGRQIKEMTVGVIGDGNIGFEVIKAFRGMGCNVITTSRHEKDAVKKYANYVTLDELIEQADIITIHCPLTHMNKNMLDEKAFQKMKTGVYVINTARGGLIDYKALQKYLDNGKVAGAGLDVFDNEGDFIRKNLKNEKIENQTFLNLIHRDDVVYTPHIAFLTDDAVSTITKITFQNIGDYFEKGYSINDLW